MYSGLAVLWLYAPLILIVFTLNYITDQGFDTGFNIRTLPFGFNAQRLYSRTVVMAVAVVGQLGLTILISVLFQGCGLLGAWLAINSFYLNK